MSRENVLLSLLFAVLGVVVLVVQNPFSADVYEETAQRSRLLFPDFDGTKATRIEVRTPDREAIVERGEDGVWKVLSRFDHPADPNTVVDLFTRLREIRVSDWISNDAADRDRYNVGDAGIRFRVTDAAGATLADFVQGKFQGIDPDDPNFERKFNFQTFLRRSDSNEVYLVEGFLPIGTTPGEWLDKALVRFDPNAAKGFVIETSDPAGKVRVEKGEDGTWKIVEPAPAPADKAKVEEWLRTFGYASLKDVAGVGGGASFGLDPPSVRLRAELQDGTSRELWVGSKTEAQEYHVSKGAEGPFVYLVQAWTIEQLKKSGADLTQPPPAPETQPAPETEPALEAQPVPQTPPSPETRPAPETRPGEGEGSVPK
jgi:hypothetical protein